MRKRLYECAKASYSRNSGPFKITLDCLSNDEQIYRKTKESGIINRTLVVELYHVPEDLITNTAFFDPAFEFKITFARRISPDTSFDRNVYGTQQHVPLMELLVGVQGLVYLLRPSRK